jgi:hypothetical protein
MAILVTDDDELVILEKWTIKITFNTACLLQEKR